MKLNWVPKWDQQDVEIKETNLIYEGFYKFKRFVLRHKQFDGQLSPWLIREQIRHSDAAAVILYDPKLQQCVLVEQLRIGLVTAYNQSPWLLEIVAGLCEPKEQPEETVLREAQEEAHCKIRQLVKIGEFYNSPGGFAEKTTLFCGLVKISEVGNHQGVPDENEDIQVHILPLEAILNALETGQFMTSSSTVIALQWLKAHYLEFTV